MSETFESQLEKVKFLEERYDNERYQWGIYSFMIDGREEEIQVIVDYKEKIIHKNLESITKLLNVQQAEIERLNKELIKAITKSIPPKKYEDIDKKHKPWKYVNTNCD